MRSWLHRTRDSIRDFPVNAHPSLEVAWVESGAARYRIGSRTTTLQPGSVMVVPWNVEHTTSFIGRAHGIAVGLDRILVEDVAGRMPPLRDGFSLKAALGGGRHLGSLCRALTDECRRHDPGHSIARRGLAEAIVVEILRVVAEPRRLPAADRRIVRAVERIHDEYAASLTVASLASAAGLSRHHFARLFRRYTGRSPQAYLTAVRMAEARRRLLAGAPSVTAVAFDVGIRDPSRFARAFRAAHGVAPSELLDLRHREP